MTDREHDLDEAFDYTVSPNRREKNTSAGMQLSSENCAATTDRSLGIAPTGALVEAACRAHEGDHEAAIAHIARAVELLQHRVRGQPARV
jgi:hypothetical protein